MRIAVSGAGVVSSIGIGVGENMSSFRDGRSGISMSPELLQTVADVVKKEIVKYLDVTI